MCFPWHAELMKQRCKHCSLGLALEFIKHYFLFLTSSITILKIRLINVSVQTKKKKKKQTSRLPGQVSQRCFIKYSLIFDASASDTNVIAMAMVTET